MNRREFIITGMSTLGLLLLFTSGASASSQFHSKDHAPRTLGPYDLRGSARTQCAHHPGDVDPWESLVSSSPTQ